MTCRRNMLRFSTTSSNFARKLVVPDGTGKRKKRVQYWTALALLRGVMSSPEAGVKMLNARLDKLASAAQERLMPTIDDLEDERITRSVTSTMASRATMRRPRFVEQERLVRSPATTTAAASAERLEKLGNIQHDQKALCRRDRPRRVDREGVQPGRLLPLHRNSEVSWRAPRARPSQEIPKA